MSVTQVVWSACEGGPQATMTRHQAQGIGNFRKVAEKYELGQRFLRFPPSRRIGCPHVLTSQGWLD